MNKDLILQILTKAHFMIPRETYLRIYPNISSEKITFDNLNMIATELHADIVLTDTIELVLTEINASLTTVNQVTDEKIKEIMDSLDFPPETPTVCLKEEDINLSQNKIFVNSINC